MGRLGEAGIGELILGQTDVTRLVSPVVVDNKSTIEVGPMDKLPKVIDLVIEAVSAGELDKVLKAALGKRRVKLRQVS